MKLDFNLQITQKQGLTLTAQVQQAIKLLQMTNLEICEFVDEQFQDNPFVEEHAFSDTAAETNPSESKNNEIDKTLEQTPYGNTENVTTVTKENQFETGEAYKPQSTLRKENSDFDAVSLIADNKKISLRSLPGILWKLSTRPRRADHSTEINRRIGCYGLDDDRDRVDSNST